MGRPDHALRSTACAGRSGAAASPLDRRGSGPQQDPDRFDDAGFREYLRRAEELGFECGWAMEQAIGPTPMLAPLELLSYAAACTSRIRLGVGVLVTSLHDPLQLAAQATAMDRLSHGRLDLGVAPGGGFRQFAAFGLREVVDAGAGSILLNPLGGSLDGDREQMERLASEVLPDAG